MEKFTQIFLSSFNNFFFWVQELCRTIHVIRVFV